MRGLQPEGSETLFVKPQRGDIYQDWATPNPILNTHKCNDFARIDWALPNPNRCHPFGAFSILFLTANPSRASSKIIFPKQNRPAVFAVFCPANASRFFHFKNT